MFTKLLEDEPNFFDFFNLKLTLRPHETIKTRDDKKILKNCLVLIILNTRGKFSRFQCKPLFTRRSTNVKISIRRAPLFSVASLKRRDASFSGGIEYPSPI